MADPDFDDFLAKQRVLVVSPHSDDESYGCAGTIARIKSLGGTVYALLVSVGGLDHFGGLDDPGMRHITAQTRLQEFTSVAELLKIDDWEVLYSDGEEHLALDTVPRRELVGLLEHDARLSIEQLRPTMLLLPWTSYNQDHEALYRAGMTATRPGDRAARHVVPHVWCYDNTGLFWSPPAERFNPTVYVDISEFLELKVEALCQHRSQLRGPLFHGSPEGLSLQSQLRGREVSVLAAEGFMVQRMVF